MILFPQNPLTKAASFSSGQAAIASSNPLTSSSSLFWNETDLMRNGNNNNKNNNNIINHKNINKIKTQNEDDTCDEEGIANGIREIEIRFENELEEQEKLWPDPENLA